MTSLAGLQEQLDVLQSHWTQVQQCARQLPGRHQSSITAEDPAGDKYPRILVMSVFHVCLVTISA